ncbi:HNH endonuclease, partial [Acinetobacter baumannii]|nr:HNH endonuclease [Acinetobacter baumannii]
MSLHRQDTDITPVKTYFNAVLDWVSGVFADVLPEMRGLEWGRLYEQYHSKPYNKDAVARRV